MTMSFVWVKILIIFEIFVENSTVESDWHVLLVRSKGSLLLPLTREHCFVKKSLKSSAFSLKSMINYHCVMRWNTRYLFIISRGL